MSNPLSAHALSALVGQTMFAADVASQSTMGMELLLCEPGRAVMRMQVRALHLNGHGICHGGFIFTLADSTFAFACNSHNQNAVAAAASCDSWTSCGQSPMARPKTASTALHGIGPRLAC